MNDVQSDREEYAIQIDPSLFSNEYGRVYFYRIYVRQSKSIIYLHFHSFHLLDMNKTTLKLDNVGTYAAAMKNQSLDYLALIVPLSSNFICKYSIDDILIDLLLLRII